MALMVRSTFDFICSFHCPVLAVAITFNTRVHLKAARAKYAPRSMAKFYLRLSGIAFHVRSGMIQPICVTCRTVFVSTGSFLVAKVLLSPLHVLLEQWLDCLIKDNIIINQQRLVPPSVVVHLSLA